VEEISETGAVDASHAGVGAYALRISGDALYPAMKHGMFAIVDPSAPCVPGEPVLIELVGGELQIRELVFDRADEVTTLSLLGGHRETIARAKVGRMSAITEVVFPSRWRSAAADVA
jgi:phage repressor protein C with HTH and peptisase S24 domain